MFFSLLDAKIIANSSRRSFMATGAAAPTIHQKPATDWLALAGPLESVGQKVGRILGKFLVFVGCPTAAGATYYVYHYMTSTPEKILAAYDVSRFLTVATAVGGAALWYFNRLDVDPKLIQQQRKNIEATIEKTPLATIRKNNPSVAISNQELNEWMRYFLHQMDYVKFIENQTDAIFDIELEQSSTDLLKEKYRAYLAGPCQLGLIALTGQKAFTVLLNETEQKAQSKLYAEKEAKSAAAYQAFIDRNGVEALNLIEDPAARQSLFSTFLDHVRAQNLGLIETRTNFAADIQGFGANAQKIVEDEIRKLETFTVRTYRELRQRNGFEEIELATLGNTSTFDEIKKKFLELPFADQLSAEFQDDCKLLNISRKEIQETMKSRWLSKPLSEILTTEQEDFKACMAAGVLVPRDWTAKAVVETGALTIQTIVKDYAELFTAGVLTAEDGNFISRLAQESLGMNLSSLIFTYGDVIFKYRLIEEAALQTLVKDFVITHASAYLGIDPNASKYIVNVSNLGLVSHLLLPIGEGQRLAKKEKELHEQRVKQINERFERHAREITDDMDILTKAERENVSLAEQNLRRAEEELNTHEQKIGSLKFAVARFEAQRASEETEKKRKQTQLVRLQEEQAGLQSQPVINLAAFQEELQKATAYCNAAEAKINHDPYAAQLKQTITALTQEAQGLESQTSEHEKLQIELAQLKEEVEGFKIRKEELQTLMNAPTPALVQGVSAGRKAQAQKEAAEKNCAELESMTAKEKRLSQLSDQLKGKEIALVYSRAQALRTQISQNQAGLDARIAQIAVYDQLPAYHQKVKELSSAIESHKNIQQAIEQNSQRIEKLNGEIRRHHSSCADAVMNLKLQTVEVNIAERESKSARTAKKNAERADAAARVRLDNKKVQVRAEQERKKKQKADEKERALQKEESYYQASLAQVTENFKYAIATTAHIY
jgi:hypothetical protein